MMAGWPSCSTIKLAKPLLLDAAVVVTGMAGIDEEGDQVHVRDGY